MNLYLKSISIKQQQRMVHLEGPSIYCKDANWRPAFKYTKHHPN